MKYILLNENKVQEIIPDFDPVFPGIPIDERYTKEFIDSLLQVSDETEVEQNWIYEDGTFHEPPEPEPTDEITGEPVPEAEPSLSEDLLTMAVDHEYRLTLLELGLGGEI